MVNRTFTLHVGRLEAMGVDAIVNAANRDLQPGAGVDGAIRAAAGPDLTAHLEGRGPLNPGAAILSPGFGLKAKWIVHTAAPIWLGAGQEAAKTALLAACYQASLATAEAAGARTIAFPAIGTGIYGWPKPLAAQTALRALETARARLRRITLCCFTAEDATVYRALMA